MRPGGDILGRFAECKALADRCEPLSPDELTDFNTLIARQKARDEARRRGTTHQANLPLEGAA